MLDNKNNHCKCFERCMTTCFNCRKRKMEILFYLLIFILVFKGSSSSSTTSASPQTQTSNSSTGTSPLPTVSNLSSIIPNSPSATDSYTTSDVTTNESSSTLQSARPKSESTTVSNLPTTSVTTIRSTAGHNSTSAMSSLSFSVNTSSSNWSPTGLSSSIFSQTTSTASLLSSTFSFHPSTSASNVTTVGHPDSTTTTSSINNSMTTFVSSSLTPTSSLESTHQSTSAEPSIISTSSTQNPNSSRVPSSTPTSTAGSSKNPTFATQPTTASTSSTQQSTPSPLSTTTTTMPTHSTRTTSSTNNSTTTFVSSSLTPTSSLDSTHRSTTKKPSTISTSSKQNPNTSRVSSSTPSSTTMSSNNSSSATQPTKTPTSSTQPLTSSPSTTATTFQTHSTTATSSTNDSTATFVSSSLTSTSSLDLTNQSTIITEPSIVSTSSKQNPTTSRAPSSSPVSTTGSLNTSSSATHPTKTSTSSTQPFTSSPSTTTTTFPTHSRTTSILSTQSSTPFTFSAQFTTTSTVQPPTSTTHSTKSTTTTTMSEPSTTTSSPQSTVSSTESTELTITSVSSTQLQTNTTLSKNSTYSTISTAPLTSKTSAAPTTSIPDCGVPPPLELGGSEFNTTTVGSVAEYFCRPGYNLTSIGTITCQTSGSWEAVDIECRPIDCGHLNVSTNGSLAYIPTNTTHFGTVAVFQCTPGFLISNKTRTATFLCLENGLWSGNTSLVCMPIRCKNLTAPTNGEMIGSGKTVESIVTFNCKSGYILEGHKSRVCLGTGKWSGEYPTCSPILAQPAKPCEEHTDYRGMSWNKTQPGQINTLSCSNKDKDLSGEITRKCTVEGKWLLPHYNCVRKELEKIKETVNAIKENPTSATVDNVLVQLSELTDTQEESTYSGELEAVTATLEVIASIDYSNITLSKEQNEAFLQTTSNLLSTNNAESWQAIDEQSSGTEEPSGASKILDVVSTYTDAISKALDDSEPRTISVSNIVLQVRKLNDSADIEFPSTDEPQNVSAALTLPQTSLEGSTTYSAVIYKNLTGVMSTKANFSSQNLELGSSVMSVKLDQWQNVSEEFKIKITFQHFQTTQVIATCSYRNENRSIWEEDGCNVTHSNSSETVCECNHLTNFAILMSPWTENNVDTEAIRIISIAGCSVSMLCLVVTVLTHLCYWKYVKSDRVKILMNLCIALLVSYGIFLGGVDRTSNQAVCTTVAVLLQYIYLVVFFLMLAEGIEISIVVLYVFTTKSRLKWILPSAWLFPALIVGISLAATQTKGYGNEKSCWLSIDDGVIWAFVGPALLIILVNFILIVLVMKAIFKTKNLSQKSNKERTIAGVRCLCVLLPLVGCTWVIGIFYVNEDLAWIQYVFAICNGLQGMAIFIFHCALNTQIRNACKRKQRYSQSTSFTRSTSNPLLIPRAKPSSSTTDLYLNTSFGEAIHQRRRHLDRGHEGRYTENLEMRQYPHTLGYFDD